MHQKGDYIFSNLKKLLKIGLQLGVKNDRRVLNKFFLGQRKGFSIYHYDLLVEHLQLVQIFIFNMLRNKGSFLFYDDNPKFERLFKYYQAQTQQTFILGRWIPGTLTNLIHVRNGVTSQNNFLGRFLIERPTSLFYFNSQDNDVLLKECFFYNIPVISILDPAVRNYLYYTYIIPGDKKSYQFLLFIFFLISYFMKKYGHLVAIAQYSKSGKFGSNLERYNYWSKFNLLTTKRQAVVRQSIPIFYNKVLLTYSLQLQRRRQVLSFQDRFFWYNIGKILGVRDKKIW